MRSAQPSASRSAHVRARDTSREVIEGQTASLISELEAVPRRFGPTWAIWVFLSPWQDFVESSLAWAGETGP